MLSSLCRAALRERAAPWAGRGAHAAHLPAVAYLPAGARAWAGASGGAYLIGAALAFCQPPVSALPNDLLLGPASRHRGLALEVGISPFGQPPRCPPDFTAGYASAQRFSAEGGWVSQKRGDMAVTPLRGCTGVITCPLWACAAAVPPGLVPAHACLLLSGRLHSRRRFCTTARREDSPPHQGRQQS